MRQKDSTMSKKDSKESKKDWMMNQKDSTTRKKDWLMSKKTQINHFQTPEREFSAEQKPVSSLLC